MGLEGSTCLVLEKECNQLNGIVGYEDNELGYTPYAYITWDTCCHECCATVDLDNNMGPTLQLHSKQIENRKRDMYVQLIWMSHLTMDVWRQFLKCQLRFH